MCFDGKDNDHDGRADCDDSDCLKDPRAARRCKHTETGRECFNGRDDDHDGKSDCDDPDCAKYGRCRHVKGHESGRLCFDGKDNDHDHRYDCDDPDCRKDPRATRRWYPAEFREVRSGVERFEAQRREALRRGGRGGGTTSGSKL